MSARTVTYQDYVAGWLDCSMHDFLQALSPSAASIKYALITCLDSDPHPASLLDKSRELRPIADKLRRLGRGLLIPTEALVGTGRGGQILFGFDEVWFLPAKGIQPPSPSVSLVGPARLNQARLDRIGPWMAQNSCSLALGSGEGLNFVVKAHGLVKTLLAYSLEQSDRVAASV